MKQRLLYLDIAKFIGIILVIIGHTPLPFSLIKIIFSVNVPIFFVIGGFLFTKSSPAKLMVKNFHSLIKPYLLTCFIVVILKVVTKCCYLPFVYNKLSLKQLLVAIIYGSGTPLNFKGLNINLIGAIWFLLAMFIANQIFNISLNYLHKYQLIVFSLFCALLGFSLSLVFNIYLPFSINASLIAQPLYLFGYLLRERKVKFNNIYLIMATTFIWLLGTKYTYFWFNIAKAKYPLIALVSSISGTYVLLALAYNLTRIKVMKIFKTPLIKSTLLILCIHYLDLHYFTFGQLIYKNGGLYLLIIYRLLLALVVSEIIIIIKLSITKIKSSI